MVYYQAFLSGFTFMADELVVKGMTLR